MTTLHSQKALQALLTAARALAESDARHESPAVAALVENLRAALDAHVIVPCPAWSGEAVLSAISDSAPQEWLWAFDHADLERASRPELLALLATAPSAAAAGYLTGVLTQRNFH